MKKLINLQFATSATALLFLIIGVSGVMMYFHFYDKYVKEMHEVLGLVFVGAVLLHVTAHKNNLKGYVKKPLFQFLSVVLLITTVLFVADVGSENKVSPKKIIIDSLLQTPLQNSIIVLKADKTEVEKRLLDEGIKVDFSKSIQDLAKENKTSPFKIVEIISKK
ncbi:DUF4405 domain-containing protein [Sulfurimonas sp.]|uniref:DUF4405 domain-containing protein n=1 Tax=Sulfurimonas sp. TaxID=2022749 RepID=UPI003D112D38